MSEWLEIGKIVAPQGLDGEVRVYSDSDFPERFEEPGQRWLLSPGESEPQGIELLAGRCINKRLYVVELAGVKNRNQAEALRGCLLMVPQSNRPQLGEDEYHVLDLIGLEVFNQLTQQVLGTVVDVIPAGNDLLEVKLWEPQSTTPTTDLQVTTGKKRKPQSKSPKPKTVLIPFVKEIAPIVDLQAGRIEIVPPPGLLEIE